QGLVFFYGGKANWRFDRPARPDLASELLHRPDEPAGVAEPAGDEDAGLGLAPEPLHLPGKPAGVGAPREVGHRSFFRNAILLSVRVFRVIRGQESSPGLHPWDPWSDLGGEP